MVSSGDSDIGAAKLTQEVLTIMQTIPGIVSSMTGVDMLQISSKAS
jgi:flotillin